jgi:hypothetical protein
MKQTTFFILLITAIIFTACSSDDDTSPTTEETTDYFPLTVGNNWDYNNQFTATGQSDFSGNETISISNTTQVSGNQAFELESSNPENSGLTTSIFTQGTLYKNNSSLIYNGSFNVGIPDFSDLSFNLENVPVYNTELAAGTEMFSESETFQEQLEGGIPITINVTVTTKMGGDLDSVSVNGTTYSDVINSEWIIELEVLAAIGPVSIPILQEQQASTIINYFAKDVGLIKSESTTTLDFEVIPQIPLEDIDSSSSQELTSHNVTID